MPASQLKEVSFDENGDTIEAGGGLPPEAEMPSEDLSADSDAPDAGNSEQPPDSEAPQGKYRIGDKEFATADEAYAYATSQVTALETEKQLADAYRQGIQDAAQAQNPVQNVTPASPPASSFDEQLYYENPAEFLKKYGEEIKTQTLQTIQQTQAEKEAGERIWREFTSRHPELADFREEVESMAAKHLTELRLVNSTKGLPAGFDFIAMKVKAKFSHYARATKPSRQLPNTRQVATGGGGTSVTPPKKTPKPLSMSEQVRSIRPTRR